MKRISFALIVATTLFAGCASTMEPTLPEKPLEGFDLVDIAQVDVAKYHTDYSACVVVANQDPKDYARTAAGVVGNVADKATFGLVGGGTSKYADRVTVLKHCLSGRGYQILR